jgi:UV DNA damage endonuclease
VFDYHHHIFCTGGDTEADALALAVSTWPDGIVPTVHYSESHELHVGNDKPSPKHSILINAIPDTHGHIIDVMVEAKGKELAILPFHTPGVTG